MISFPTFPNKGVVYSVIATIGTLVIPTVNVASSGSILMIVKVSPFKVEKFFKAGDLKNGVFLPFESFINAATLPYSIISVASGTLLRAIPI